MPSDLESEALLPSMPLPRTPLVGRQTDVAEVRALLGQDDIAVVTVLGPGGVGKTRLALEVVRDIALFPDGMHFVPLASVREPDGVLPAIARAIGIRYRGTDPLPMHLAEILAGKQVLLILDNIEQVIDVALQLSELIAACPSLTVLVTSRTALRIAGEHRYLLAPLSLPASGYSGTADDLASIDAVALFVRRARDEDPTFALTDSSAGVIAEICTRLDGLPLAIELAAARLRVLSPEGLLARLADPLRVLGGGARDQPDRLQTMRNAISWSHDLLAPQERVVFRRLAVFPGDFALEAAEAVTSAPETDFVEVLATLVDNSLVQRVERQSAEPRFGMLDTIREFALAQLIEIGEETEIRYRHLTWYLAMAEREDLVPYTPEKHEANRRLEAELANLRTAIGVAMAQSDPEPALRLVTSLWWYWEASVSLTEASAWATQLAGRSAGLAPHLDGVRAQLLAQAAIGALFQNDPASAAPLIAEAELLARRSDSDRALIAMLISKGHYAIDLNQLDKAWAPLSEALDRIRMSNDPSREIECLWRLAYLRKLRGEWELSDTGFGECLAVARRWGWQTPISYTLEALATSAREQADYTRAASLLSEALALASDEYELSTLANCIRSLGIVASMTGQVRQGVRLFGAADALYERQGTGMNPAEREYREQTMIPAKSVLPPSAFASAWAEGRTLPLETAIAEAQAIARATIAGAKPKPAAPEGLTRREIEVLRLLVEGRSDREIAEALFVSRHTAANHVGNILGKLAVPSRAAAAAWAVRNNIA